MHTEGSDCMCEMFQECAFFQENEGLDNTIKTVRDLFCSGGGKVNCARYAVLRDLGQENVPKDLLPFDYLAVEELIRGKEKVPA